MACTRSRVRHINRFQQVEWRHRVRGRIHSQMQVAHGGADGGMSESPLDDGQADAGVKQRGSIAVPKRMDTTCIVDAGLGLDRGVDCADAVTAEVAVGALTRKQPVRRSPDSPIGAKFVQQPRRQWYVAVFVALALVDAYGHASGIDVANPQAGQFADA